MHLTRGYSTIDRSQSNESEYSCDLNPDSHKVCKMLSNRLFTSV